MKYIELKTSLLSHIKDLKPNDFYLLEGKLIFKLKSNADIVKKYLQDKDYKVVQTSVRNWEHWQGNYESILYFKDLEKESNG